LCTFVHNIGVSTAPSHSDASLQNVVQDDISLYVDLAANSENIQPGMVDVFFFGTLMRFFLLFV
jgi:hypothetical protein